MKTYKKYLNFEEKLKEHALYFGDLERFDNYLDNINNEKKILKNLSDEMDKFKELILEFNDPGKFNMKYKTDGKYIIGNVVYNDRIEMVLKKFKETLEEIDDPDILLKANKIIYGSEEEMDFNPRFQIDTLNFNRIDINNELPYSIRNIGFGKILYKTFIKKLGYLSSNYGSSKDSKFVWESLSNDNKLYTCIKDLSIVCFDGDLDINIIENILRKWVKNSDDYVIDTDLLKKYPDLEL